LSYRRKPISRYGKRVQSPHRGVRIPDVHRDRQKIAKAMGSWRWYSQSDYQRMLESAPKVAARDEKVFELMTLSDLSLQRPLSHEEYSRMKGLFLELFGDKIGEDLKRTLEKGSV